MNTIYVIKPLEMMSAVQGKTKTSLLFYVGFPLLVLACAFALIYGEELYIKAFGLLGVLFFGFCGWLLFRGEQEYKPGKTYVTLRGSKEKMKQMINYSCVAGIFICFLILCFGFIEEQRIKSWMGYAFSGIIGLVYYMYYNNKSFKVHEDIDFVSSEEMERIIGAEIGEKIQATYQNFDSSVQGKLEDDSNLMILSDKKIFFSYIEKGEWLFIKKNINEVVKIGIFDDSYNNNKIYLRILFSDNTDLMLHLETYGKTTSNALLFIRKLLVVLDAVVLGTVDEKITSRRRVSVNQETKPIESQKSENKEVRRLDLSEDMIEKLRNATPVESGRVLEF